MRIDTFLDEAVKLHLDAVDLSILMLRNLSAKERGHLRQQIAERGLHVLEITTYPDFTHPDATRRISEIKLFDSALEAAASVGAKLVRVTAGQAHPGLDRGQAIEFAVAGISNAIARAKELGIMLVFENHSKPGVWDYYDFDFPTANFLDILDALPGEVGVQFDTANSLVYGDAPIDVLNRVIDRVAIIHVADTRTTGHLEPTVIGTGLVPFPQLFSRLRQADYHGWLSIEEASGTGFAGMKTAVDYVRSTWEGAR
jgi:sugar phosphate isomerase/epimerase